MSDLASQQKQLVADAIGMYRQSDDALWEFALCPALELVGQNQEGVTIAIAEGIKRSIDTVEGYAKVGKLWSELIRRFPNDSELWRADLYIGHFVAVAKKRFAKAGITLTDAANHLANARVQNWTVERLRDELPATGTRAEIWFKSVRTELDRIEKKIIHAPSLDEDEKIFYQAGRLSKKYVAMMRKITEKK